jgi:hypothetical protein
LQRISRALSQSGRIPRRNHRQPPAQRTDRDFGVAVGAILSAVIRAARGIVEIRKSRTDREPVDLDGSTIVAQADLAGGLKKYPRLGHGA